MLGSKHGHHHLLPRGCDQIVAYKCHKATLIHVILIGGTWDSAKVLF
jgi:hypothetical protein